MEQGIAGLLDSAGQGRQCRALQGRAVGQQSSACACSFLMHEHNQASGPDHPRHKHLLFTICRQTCLGATCSSKLGIQKVLTQFMTRPQSDCINPYGLARIFCMTASLLLHETNLDIKNCCNPEACKQVSPPATAVWLSREKLLHSNSILAVMHVNCECLLNVHGLCIR